MLTTQHVLDQLQVIRTAPSTSLRKVRELIKLRRQIEGFIANLERGASILRSDCEDDAATRIDSRLEEMRICLMRVRFAILDIATNAKDSARKSFGYANRSKAYPGWMNQPVTAE